MVQDANIKRMHMEKLLEEAKSNVSGLVMQHSLIVYHNNRSTMVPAERY